MFKNIMIVQARMRSARLPGKSLMPIWKDISLLEVVLRRVTKAITVDRVILATSTNKKDDVLIPIAEKRKVEVFRGSENDVLGRFARTLEQYPAEAVVRACADNPFLDPMMIDNLTKFFWENYPCDYAMNLGPKTGFPDSVGAEMVAAETLKLLDKKITNSHDREHVLTYLYDNPKFKSEYLYATDEYKRPDYRIDMDYPEDLEFIRKLIKLLPSKNAPYWTTIEIIKTLDKDKELLKLRRQR